MKKKKSKTHSIHYYDETGRRRGKTFSAPTLTEAKLKAEAWKERRLSQQAPSMTVLDAVEGYIEVKRGVLSPSSVRGYEGMLRTGIANIGDKSINGLSKADIQAWISSLAANHSAKTVKNYWGLFRPALAMYGVDAPKITLPQARRFENYCPNDSDIAALLAEVRRKRDLDLLRGIYLAAFIPARRSEICALTKADINGNAATINKALVKAPGGGWALKQPKEKDSYRTVELPAFVIKELKAAPDRIVSYTPDTLYNHFRRTLLSLDIPLFRFHDLRHYGASIMMYQGISQRTIEQRGGWSPGSPVLKRIYQNTIEAEQRKEDAKINAHFSKFM